MRIGKYILATSLLLSISTVSSAQDYEYFPRNDFSVDHIDIHDGTLWLAAGRDGAVQFDPATGDYSYITEDDGLYHSDVVCMVEVDSSGTIWVGMGQGLIEYDGETMTRYGYVNGLFLAECYDMYEDDNGLLWFVARNSIYTYDGVDWTRYDKNDGLGDYFYEQIVPASDGSLWVKCERQISQYADGEWTTYKPSLNWDEYTQLDYVCLMVDRDGLVWIGTNQGIMTFDGENWNTFSTEDGLNDVYCSAIGQCGDGRIWAALGPGPWSRNSFSVFDGETWSAWPDTDNTVSAKIVSVYKADDGSLWFGADNCEMYHVQDGTVEAIHIETGINASWVYAVAVDNKNAVWTGSDKGVQRLKDGEWTTYYKRHSLPSGTIRDLAVTEAGTVWAAADSGVAYSDGDDWTQLKNEEGFTATGASSISCSGSSVWLGTDQGISRIDSNGVTGFPMPESLPDSLTAIFAESENAVWAGTLKGLGYYDGESWTEYTTGNGLPDNTITDIHADPRGVLWVSTVNGLASFDGSNWTSFTVGDGVCTLADTTITAMTVDNSGRIWFGTSKGSSWFDGSEWGADPKFNGIFDFAVGQDNVLWAARHSIDGELMNGALVTDEPGRLLPGTFASILPAVYTKDITVTDSSVWLVSGYEIYRFDKTSRIVDSSLTMENATPFEITAYSDDKVMIVSNSNVQSSTAVFHKFNGTSWKSAGSITCPRFIIYVREITYDPSGNLWYWRCYQSIGRVKTGLGTGTNEFSCHEIFFASDNSAWIAGESLMQSAMPYNAEFSSYSSSDWIRIEKPEIIYDISAIEEDINGDLLFGTENENWSEFYGVARFDGNEWSYYNVENGLLSNRVYDIAVDHRGAIWISTDKGISYLYNNQWTEITTANSILPRQDNGAIIEVDRDGVVWIGCLYGGLVSFTYDETVAVDETETTPSPFSLDNVFPNPFNPSTTISFRLEKAVYMSLSVYNISGQKIRELKSGMMTAGKHRAVWNGLDDSGTVVSSGVYFAVLSGGEKTTTKRMLLLK